MYRISLGFLNSDFRILWKKSKMSIRNLNLSSSICDKSTHNHLNSSMLPPEQSQFLNQFCSSLQELEVAVGYSQKELHSTLRSTMPLLSNTHSSTMNGADHQLDKNRPVDDSEAVARSIQLKLAFSSSELTKPVFPGIGKVLLQKFQQKLIDDDEWDHTQDTAPTFPAIRPSESFLVLLIAHLMNSRLMGNNAADQQSEPLRKHLFTLLNIIQLIRTGTNTRIGDCGQVEQQPPSDTNSAGVDRYRWSIQKGNFYLYAMTYSLLRLNAQNVTNLMNTSLQSITAIQYWLEREATTKLTKQANGQICTTPAVRRQLAQGGLMSVWESVVASRDSCLLANGCEAMAYLLGKENVAQYRAAMQLGATLGQILSLMDDYCAVKQLQTQSSGLSEQWTTLSYFNFLLRLPVLLYLKEATGNIKLELPLAENKCHKMVLNTIAHIDESEALAKTRALIEYFVRIAEQQVTTHYEESQVRTTFLTMLQTCASIK